MCRSQTEPCGHGFAREGTMCPREAHQELFEWRIRRFEKNGRQSFRRLHAERVAVDRHVLHCNPTRTLRDLDLYNAPRVPQTVESRPECSLFAFEPNEELGAAQVPDTPQHVVQRIRMMGTQLRIQSLKACLDGLDDS